MSREEDLVRSTAVAIAATVREVPPLLLPTVTDDPRTVARHAGGVTRGARRLRGWLVPVAAAAVVLAIALSLVLIRDIPNRRVAAPARPAPAVDGVPAYYAGLAETSAAQSSPEQIVVGQTVTGKRLATLAPPAGTTFAGITGAADDRTFVVDTQPGTLDAESEPWQPRTWYLLRIDPGSAKPAELTPLPIPATAAGTNVAAIALSPDGTELAVALQPDGLNDPSAADLPAGLLGRHRGPAAFVVRGRRERPFRPAAVLGRAQVRRPGQQSRARLGGSARAGVRVQPGHTRQDRGRVRRLDAEGDPRPDPVHLRADEKRR